MNKRKLPDGLKKQQEERMKETLDKVQKAIDELTSEGYLISTKILIERTGLSRSTFSKEHVKNLLKANKIGKFKEVKVVTEDKEENYKNIASKYQTELLKSNKKVEKLEEELKKKDERLKSRLIL